MEQNLQNAVANAMGITEVTEQGGNTPESQPSTDTQANVTTDNVQAQETSNTQTEVTQNNSTTTTTTENKGESSTIKGMREQLANQKAEYKKLEDDLKRIEGLLGKSREEILAEAQQKADKAKADSLGVSPEVAKTIREQEQRIKELEQASIREDFNNRANNFRREYNLNDKQLSDFFNDAIQKGFDLMRKGTDLGVIYRAINFDKLSAAKEAEIRQNILNEMQQQRENANGFTNVNNQANTTDSSLSGTNQDFVKAIYNNFNK